MSPTKILLLFFILSFGFTTWAQEESPAAAEPAAESGTESPSTTAPDKIKAPLRRGRTSFWGVSLSSLTWNDKLIVNQGTTSDAEYANTNGFILTVQKEYFIRRWGYSLGLFGGVGQANGGGNSKIVTFNQSKLNVVMFGASPRGFYRLTDKITLGGTAMILSRKADWQGSAGQSIDAPSEVTGALLADINLRLWPRWEFYQGVGPLMEGTTLWKLGVNYRF